MGMCPSRLELVRALGAYRLGLARASSEAYRDFQVRAFPSFRAHPSFSSLYECFELSRAFEPARVSDPGRASTLKAHGFDKFEQ